MSISVFIDIWAGTADTAALERHYRDAVIPRLLDTPGALSLHLYVPDRQPLPFGNDENSPDISLEIIVSDIASIPSLLMAPANSDGLRIPDGGKATHDIFRRLTYPVADANKAEERHAPVTFGVRYYPPVSDAKSFVDHYLAHHPPLLGRLPKIRNVLCYTPIDCDQPLAFPGSGCILGNEVVFDSMKDLADALKSDALDDVLADSHANPVQRGPGTHFAYLRTDYFKRPINQTTNATAGTHARRK